MVEVSLTIAHIAAVHPTKALSLKRDRKIFDDYYAGMKSGVCNLRHVYRWSICLHAQ